MAQDPEVEQWLETFEQPLKGAVLRVRELSSAPTAGWASEASSEKAVKNRA